MKRRLAVLLPLLAFACQDVQPPLAPPDAGAAHSAVTAAGTISGRFIVTVRDGVAPADVARDHGATPDYLYTHALNGFAGAISEAARQGLLRDNRALRLEPDQVVTISATQSNATWGLDRIDQRALPLSGTFSYDNTGSGVNAYIIDTGIRRSHSDFGSRAFHGYTAISDGRGSEDCNGHGTHVAGTVGGAAYGVAKRSSSTRSACSTATAAAPPRA